MTYVVTLASSGNSSATVNFTENSGFVGQYNYSMGHATNVYHGSFVAYEGVAYGVEAKAGADPDLGGSAEAEVVMTIKANGRLRVVMDTRYDRDVADNPVTVYPPNYFFPPHGAANDWTTTFTYDTRGRMLSRTTPDGGYDSQNRPLVSGIAHGNVLEGG